MEMSAEAQRKLQKLWKKLHFSTVKRTIAHQPEDVSSIAVMRPFGAYPNGTPMFNGVDYFVDHGLPQRTSSIPAADRWRAQVNWRYYYGFDAESAFFQMPDCHGLDLDIDLYCDFSAYGNHTNGSRRPHEGQLIYGVLEEDPRGIRYKQWYPCDEAFKLLYDVIMGTEELTEQELGVKLLTDGYPDKYWALARLVLFDNVQAFVELHRWQSQARLFDGSSGSEAPASLAHPGSGQAYGTHGFTCSSHGMHLPMSPAKYVHTLSYQLGEPRWWDEFVEKLSTPSRPYVHDVGPGDFCRGCKYGHLEYIAR